MRVAVEATVEHHLLQKRLGAPAGQLLAIDPPSVQLLQLIDLDPFDVLHDQHAGSDKPPVHLGDLDARKTGEVFPKAHDVPAFDGKVQLPPDPPGKLPARAPRGRQAQAAAVLAPGGQAWRISMSVAMVSSMPGRRTLTTTSLPSCSTARCT